MAARSPFAFGHLGDVLITTDNDRVFVSPVEKGGPRWAFQAAGPVAGVRDTKAGVLVVDAKGVFTLLARPDGKPLARANCAVEALGLVATAEGAWAIVYPTGVCIGQGPKPLRKLTLPALTCAALDETGTWLALGTQAGEVCAIGLAGGPSRKLRLPGAITGLAFSKLAGWYVCTAKAVYKVALDLSRPESLLAAEDAGGCVASPDGSLCAFRTGPRSVRVIDSHGNAVGSVSYPERLVGEIEFGSSPWLGIGVGGGDGNRVSLRDGIALRTEPAPGRPPGDWKVVARLEASEAAMDAEAFEEAEPDAVLAEAVEEPEEAVVLAEEEPAPIPRRKKRRDRDAGSPGTPFVLEEHERVLLRGGFGGRFGWGWTLAHVFAWVVCTPLAVLAVWLAVRDGNLPPLAAVGTAAVILVVTTSWPFLRSGRYWLTTSRLHWKPRLGSAVAVPLSSIDPEQIDVGVMTSSLKVRGKEGTTSLRYLSDVDRLWGGLILFCQLGELEPATGAGEAIQEVACWPADCVEMTSSQPGMAVLRPKFFAFLPSEEKSSMLGKMASDIADEVLDQETVEVNAKLPVDLLLELLYQRDRRTFDKYVRRVVKQQDGFIWEPGDAEVSKEAFPLQPSRHVLIFTQGGTAVRGVPTRERETFVDEVVGTWTDGEPIPLRQPVWRMVKTSLLLTVPAVLIAGAGSTRLNNPEAEVGEFVLGFGCAGSLGLLGLLCWLLTAVVMLRAMRRAA